MAGSRCAWFSRGRACGHVGHQRRGNHPCAGLYLWTDATAGTGHISVDRIDSAWIGPLLPYARQGNVDWRLGLLLAAGIGVGGYFGGQAAQHVSQGLLRRSFAVVLAAVACRMFFQR